MKTRVAILIQTFLLAGCWHGNAQVGVPPTVVRASDPPGRVARISYIGGAVSLKVAGTDAWVAAKLNRPLTAGDEVYTDTNARAELDLGHAFVRLDSQTNISILNLDDQGIQISLAEGTVQVRLRRLDEDDAFEIDTPQAALTLLRTGEYRIHAQASADETIAIVRSGQFEAIAPGQSFSIRAQQRARMTGTEMIQYEITPAPPLDSFDDFCQTRDRRTEKAESLRYLSPHVIGWEDLDEYGLWQAYPAYGSVWFPRAVGSGWAPYRFGHWIWIEPWGWTWIDDAPWGFAPFHYGRWVFVNARWGWVPGPIHVRAIYAPALVVFAGGGPGLRYYFSVGFGIGVAWFPLGPHEIYIPPYHSSRRYVTNVNVSHTIVRNTNNIWNTDMARQRYVNRNVSGAFTAVPEDVFMRGRPVAQAAIRVSPQDIQSARIGGTAPPVIPNRGSMAPVPDSPTTVPRPPDRSGRREPVVRRTPAPGPVPFEQRRPVLERDPGRPADPTKVEDLRRDQPQPTPPFRQVRPVPAPPTSPQPTPPVVRPDRTPRQPPPVQPQAPRQTEDRRRTIEQERQRAEPQPQTPPVDRSRGRGGRG